MKDGIDVRLISELEDAPAIVEVPGGPGTQLNVLSHFEATARGKELPYNVWFRAVLEGTTYVMEDIRLTRKARGGPITSEALRQIPVAALMKRAVELVILLGTRDRRLDLTGGFDDPNSQIVAEIYRVGVLMGESPTMLVANTFGLSRATAGRWISRARREGFLGPALGTKAGEGVK